MTKRACLCAEVWLSELIIEKHTNNDNTLSNSYKAEIWICVYSEMNTLFVYPLVLL